MFSRGKVCFKRSVETTHHGFIGWTTAFISPIMDAQSRSPTVMHALLYWLGSALSAPGGFVQPVEVALNISVLGIIEPSH
jgi:hypothetical protein